MSEKFNEKLDSSSEKILEIYSRELDQDERFHHALEEAAKHPPKISKIYERGEEGHLKEEVVDLLLLAHVLKKNTRVSEEELDSAADHFIDRIDGIYGE
jgi:hypothetical protein